MMGVRFVSVMQICSLFCSVFYFENFADSLFSSTNNGALAYVAYVANALVPSIVLY